MSKLQREDLYHWHPFTQMEAFFEENPPVIVKGLGCELYDEQGKRYLDGISSLWCNVHGHRRRELDEALELQLKKIAHTTMLGLRAPGADELAKRLVGLAPDRLRWVFYSDSGSSAVEIALKMAFQYWRNKGETKRTKFISLGDSYHGDTIGSVSLGGIDLFHRIFSPLLFDGFQVPAPHCRRCPLKKSYPECDVACALSVEKLLEEHRGEIAAVVLEPLVQGAAGMIVHPPGFLSRMRKVCDSFETLLVCDEVATGFGRTGKMFACEHEEVSPDIMCLAKGITGGYLPLAATLASERIFAAFLGSHDEGKHFFHGHTYTGNALACAVALASLDILENDNVIEGLYEKIALLEKLLKPLDSHHRVFEVRQRGLMVGIELSEDPQNDKPYDPKLRMGHQVIVSARNKGVIIRPLGDVVVLMPALTMSEKQLEELVMVTIDSIDEVTT